MGSLEEHLGKAKSSRSTHPFPKTFSYHGKKMLTMLFFIFPFWAFHIKITNLRRKLFFKALTCSMIDTIENNIIKKGKKC